MEHDNLSDAVAYIQALYAQNKRLRTALQWIADQVDNEDGDLDDIILCANKALAHEQGEDTTPKLIHVGLNGCPHDGPRNDCPLCQSEERKQA